MKFPLRACANCLIKAKMTLISVFDFASLRLKRIQKHMLPVLIVISTPLSRALINIIFYIEIPEILA